MAITAQQIINDALLEIGVLAEGDTPSTQMLSDGLRWLNRMLDTFSNDQSFAYFPNLLTWDLTATSVFTTPQGSTAFYVGPALTNTFTVTIATPAVFTCANHGLAVGDTVTFSTTGALPTGLTAGTTYYVISTGFTSSTFEVSTTSGGTAVNTTGTQSGTHTFTQASSLTKLIAQRPIRVETAFVQRSGISYQVRVVDNRIWDTLIYQGVQGANTAILWYEAQMDNGIVHLYPSATSCTIEMRVVNQVVNFAALSTSVNLPPGYEECLVANLAVRIAPQYPSANLSPITVKNAKATLSAIKKQNNVVPILNLPSITTNNRSGSGLANFYGGYL